MNDHHHIHHIIFAIAIAITVATITSVANSKTNHNSTITPFVGLIVTAHPITTIGK